MIDLIRRQIELLKLLSKQREYKPASFFSKSLDVSTKTIYTDITYLQSEVEKYKVDLVRAPRIGIRLEGLLTYAECFPFHLPDEFLFLSSDQINFILFNFTLKLM